MKKRYFGENIWDILQIKKRKKRKRFFYKYGKGGCISPSSIYNTNTHTKLTGRETERGAEEIEEEEEKEEEEEEEEKKKKKKKKKKD